MDTVTFVKGKMEEYISDREFSLNFEDRKIASVKVRKGDLVLYDGEVAAYTKPSGEEVKARCPSLKAAILSGWMRMKNGKTVVPKMVSHNVVGTEYDPLKGGSFDEYVGKDKDIHLARSGTSKRPVEDYNARILRPAMPEANSEATEGETSATHEVASGETPVREIPADKERLVVTSSTVPPKAFKRGMQVVSSNNAGAQTSTKMTRIPKKASKDETKAKTTLIDGNVMNSPLPADATLEDVKKVYGKAKEVVQVDGDTQDSKVVKKIGEKIQDQTRSEEGITFRKTLPRTNDARAKTSMGEPSLTMDGAEQKVVKTIGKTAAAHPEAQEVVKDEVPVVAPEMIRKEDGTPDYLSMLPDNWARMHWVQKEKFVLSLNDVDFIKFILQVETLAAVRNACTERLKQLESTPNG